MTSSLSVSAENLSNDPTNDASSTMCLELALEGERLCKSGDCRAGVAFFQAAIQAGTDDLRTLSAIYSQLGNAYFYLGDYQKAMQYHKLDLTLARSMNDRLGEAKSSGNLGNTLKVMGRFDEAALCCERHLTIARQLGDRLSEGRALYNLGNVYHAKGKQIGQKEGPGDNSEEVKDSLMKAVDFYQQNLSLMREIGDRSAQGRSCGNLGNTFYLLGDFNAAIEHHQERLRIAREFGDKAAERRANSNLGNSHIFLGQFELAADHYKKTLSLAMELGERAVEAQACYSLGNTYILLRDFPTAIDYHQRHLGIAQELGDKIGEARACWSLGNAHAAIGNHEKALHYAQLHLFLAKELGDPVGETTARINIADLKKVLNVPDSSDAESLNELHQKLMQKNQNAPTSSNNSSGSRLHRMRRQSMEQLDLIKLTPDSKKQQSVDLDHLPSRNNENFPTKVSKEEDFFEMLSRTQSKRMDDQRCTLKAIGSSEKDRKPLVQQNNNMTTKDNKNLLEMIADFQSERMDEQRCALLPGWKRSEKNPAPPITEASNDNNIKSEQDEPFSDMLQLIERCQGSRYDEQRSELPKNNVVLDAETNEANNVPVRNQVNPRSTLPDEDFFSLIMRVQGGRMEDQRATVPTIPKNQQQKNSK
ncbi:CLUMA_CG021331, isoform A [Clunio marinus]|uniref:CLUMA_CG021331, isoform A n=1 Tax=Clunio marinus TaxID=568069 RepID=A0A1J1JA02_9DIPT|nr:CLUMA_CG021331, isoform A [Clunio marinus]